MNKSGSKYNNTALLMNQALIELLNKKDYDYITIKEICVKAGVNRSTFYLHYDTIDDLLDESIRNINKQFLNYFDKTEEKFIEKINKSPKEDLILVTSKYLTPYLMFMKDNRTIYEVAIKHSNIMHTHEKFNSLNKYIFKPIFRRFDIDDKAGNYMIFYYLNGVNAIISEWIRNGCKDEIEYIEKIIVDCVRPCLENRSL